MHLVSLLYQQTKPQTTENAAECLCLLYICKYTTFCRYLQIYNKQSYKQMKKITKNDILSIKGGDKRVFFFDDCKALRSAQTYVYQLAKYDKPDGVSKYSCKANFEDKSLLIEAQSVES